MATAPKTSKRTHPKRGLPSKADILAFIQESEGRTSRRDIARAFNVRGDDRVELKRILRELTDEGAIDKPKGKIEELGGCHGTMVLDITGTDTDGELLRHPANWSGKGKPPQIRLAPGRVPMRPALGVGERVLAKVRGDGDGGYEAVVEKRLGASAHEVLGVVRKAPRGRTRPAGRPARARRAASRRCRSGRRSSGRARPVRSAARTRSWTAPCTDQRSPGLAGCAQVDQPDRNP